MKYLIISFVIIFQNSIPVTGVQEAQEIVQEESISKSTKVAFGADSSFYLYNGIGPYSLESRSARIKSALETFGDSEFDASMISIEKSTDENDIFYKEQFVMTVTAQDAKALGLSKNAATQYYTDMLLSFNKKEEKETLALKSLIINIGIALSIIILFVIGLRYFNRLFRLLYMKINGQKGKLLTGFKIKTYELLTEEKQVLFLTYVAKGLRLAVLILIIYLLLPVLFSLFPWTQDIATTLFGYILDPLKSIGSKFLDFIPNLLTIAVIWFVTRYILKVLLFFKDEVARGKLELPGFYPEWAKPTYNIIKILVIALSFIAIWPLLPMSDSEIFKGVSTFIGLLVALGGAGAISNVIAGLVITYMRSFKIGDRVKIGDVMGDVKEKSLLNTRIKTIKNEIITIPNSQMLNSHTINYTTANDEEGLILNTTITIGYDVPWRKVHDVLIEAALETEFIKKLPKPYVLQTSLDDFYVSYQLNARTREIHKMAVIYSEMHKNIQDKCNEAGIEILSPHYGAQRDGNHSTIPQEHLPDNYQAPWFRLKNITE
ncbi:mechanosensitive ion channel family protein [Roseivirga sp. E12]|uniref:mechanosensitive ion channel family protein n=1 Tax=Roseivirga sp. E12 TaxID=2819237 RepID=UPI001ABC52AC|nr:mechanosensitive ion channel family protein [Roseivirga sp. E12]MBO3698709.1 mechanosensitive ion channel family protein [Roseivirga sp. E12]